MADNNPNPNDKPFKPAKYDQAAILVAKSYPELNNEQIGKKLVELGVSKNPKTIHDKWNKSDYLRRELTEVRNKNISEIQRKHVPKALKKLNSILTQSNDKKLQLQAVNTTLKYGMGEALQTPTAGVSIQAINIASVNILADIRNPGGAE